MQAVGCLPFREKHFVPLKFPDSGRLYNLGQILDGGTWCDEAADLADHGRLFKEPPR